MVTNAPKVILPNRSLIQATHREVLDLNPLLTPTYRTVHIFPHFQSRGLIFIGQLCDDGCLSTFTVTNLNVVKDGIKVL